MCGNSEFHVSSDLCIWVLDAHKWKLVLFLMNITRFLSNCITVRKRTAVVKVSSPCGVHITRGGRNLADENLKLRAVSICTPFALIKKQRAGPRGLSLPSFYTVCVCVCVCVFVGGGMGDRRLKS